MQIHFLISEIIKDNGMNFKGRGRFVDLLDWPLMLQ